MPFSVLQVDPFNLLNFLAVSITHNLNLLHQPKSPSDFFAS